MNWKLIFGLSLLGLAMSFATVFWEAPRLEPLIWVLIFLLSAWLIAKNASGKYFLHGFLVNIVNSIWTTAVHIIFEVPYLAHHTLQAAQYAKMDADTGISATKAIILAGLTIGIFSGCIIGLLALAAARILALLERQ